MTWTSLVFDVLRLTIPTFLILVISSTRGCEFPPEIQSQVPNQSWKRSWHGEVREQLTGFGFQLEINGSVIRRTPVDSRTGPAPLTRRCIRRIDGDRYLVSDEDQAGSTIGYSCLRFVVRSEEVLQVWSSNISRGMSDELCSDGSMAADRWLVIDRTRFGSSRIRCPLEGGFNLNVFDKLRQRGVCDAWNGEIRLESECSHGDGFVFLFRSQSCVPEGMYMYFTQPTHCLVTWTEGSYNFTILKHELFNYAWLLRVPSSAEDIFSALLFKDFFADTTHFASENINYLRLDFSRNRPRDQGDLCFDDYERCTFMTAPCVGGFHPPQAALTCPLKCGLCQKSSPVRCRLRPDWIGKWDTDGKSNSVTINGTGMIRHSHHVSRNMECIQWNEVVSGNNTVMFVTEYENGCKARYTCARFEAVSPSQLNITLSKTVTWPFVQADNEPLDCSGSGFKPRNPQEANVTRNFLLHWRTAQHPVNCHLPFRASGAEVYFANGTTCESGRLTESRNRKVVEFTLNGCSESGIVRNYELSCSESNRFPPDDDLIIVARTLPSLDVYCLVFPFADDTTFHLLRGADHCQKAILRESSLESVHLLRGTLSEVTLRATVPKTILTTELSSESPKIDSTTDSAPITSAGPSDLPVPVTRTPKIDESTVGVTGVMTTASIPTEHPFVVGFVAFIIGLMQSMIYFFNCL